MTIANIEELKIRLTGTRPLLMCRGEGANPFDEQARKIKTISQKRRKSDEDHELLARLQFESSAYYDEKIGPYVPTDNIWKCCQEGAAKYKEASLVKSNVLIRGIVGRESDVAAAALIYKGPRKIDELYAEKRFVLAKMGKIPGSRTSILVVRPIFPEWAVEFVVQFTDIDRMRILDYFRISGQRLGIGAWRPRHGLFTAEVIK